jgi:hypothetical protein
VAEFGNDRPQRSERCNRDTWRNLVTKPGRNKAEPLHKKAQEFKLCRLPNGCAKGRDKPVICIEIKKRYTSATVVTIWKHSQSAVIRDVTMNTSQSQTCRMHTCTASKLHHCSSPPQTHTTIFAAINESNQSQSILLQCQDTKSFDTENVTLQVAH